VKNLGEDDYLFADALAGLSDAEVVLLGVPFDGTSSHRSGSSKAPAEIRRESYNYESYLNKYNFNIEDVPIHDMGDYKDFQKGDDLFNNLPGHVMEIIKAKKFLITLGGEHSITVPIVKSYLNVIPKTELGIIYLDAHLDFRYNYLDNPRSHASVARRLFELVGEKKIVEIGIRSFSVEESVDAKANNIKFFTADIVNELGMKKVIDEALEYLDTTKIYLTLDMDVLDPAYAPGVGNPEYFGLTPWQIRDCFEILGPNLVGADFVEVSPPYDNGNTAGLAAQFIQILISQIMK
jgi:agmatinase